VNEWIQGILVAIGSALLALTAWVIRRIFTNQREIEILRAGIENIYKTTLKENQDLRHALERETDARIQETREVRKLNEQLVLTIKELAKK